MLTDTLVNRRNIRVVGALLEGAPGCYLITQRAPGAILPLLWEFPGGQVQEGESDVVALGRELKERLELAVTVGEEMMATHHEYDTYTIDFRVFQCRLAFPGQQVSHDKINDHCWVSLSDMSQFQFPPADARTLAKLLDLDQ